MEDLYEPVLDQSGAVGLDECLDTDTAPSCDQVSVKQLNCGCHGSCEIIWKEIYKAEVQYSN